MGFDRRLGSVFGFDADDLEANRAGRLSDEQRRGFTTVATMTRRRSRRVLPVFFLLLAGAAVLAVVGSGSAEGVELDAETLGPVAVVAVMGTFMVSLIVFFGRRARRDQAVHAAGRVLRTEGRFEYDPTWDGTWGVDIGGVRFLVELLQYQALDDEAAYSAYYLATQPHATLLSIEEV